MVIFQFFGGFKLKKTKGSISTLVRAKIGPNNGDKLKIDEKIFFNKSPIDLKTNKFEFEFDNENTIRVMKGLQFDYFSKKSQEDFFKGI